jgi:Cellulase (glycosyl hydrolase family 5)
MATYFKDNPYVWFGTNNEPSLIYPGNSSAVATGPQSLSAWQKATYNAIRGTGNTNPILLEPGGDAVGNFRNGAGIPMMAFQDPTVVATMTNVIWDPHIYGFMNNNATDAASNNLLVSEVIAACQAVKSADGIVPCIIGEFVTTHLHLLSGR